MRRSLGPGRGVGVRKDELGVFSFNLKGPGIDRGVVW